MRTVVLTEYVSSEPIMLSLAQRDALGQLVSGLTITPEAGRTDTYTLTSSSSVGVARVGDLTLELRPKIGIAPVLFLISYALNPKSWKSEHAQLARDANLAEAVIPLFTRTVQQTIGPGLLHGYLRCEDTLTSVRGRVRIADQFRTRTGLPLPVEVTYDDFTPDILENRLLRTAVDTLGRLYLRQKDSRTSLARLRLELNGISNLTPDRRGVPEPHWTRLNERYRAAVALARLIISTAGLEARAGGIDASVFLIDMNAVFERFIRAALREALRLDVHAFPPAARGRPPVYLDAERAIRLGPDLSWWANDRCVFVGDCKYKKTDGTIPNADVYQMLAYLTALQLTQGLLVYAAGEDVPRSITIPFADKRVLIRTIDVSQAPNNVLSQTAKLASLIRSSTVYSPAPATTGDR
jgi:5-methylcytosine-specific restriction enzyme subunit McrC